MKNPEVACPTNPDKICPHREEIVRQYSYDDDSSDISDDLRFRDVALRGSFLAENSTLAQILSCAGPIETDDSSICITNESIRHNKIRRNLGQIVRSFVGK